MKKPLLLFFILLMFGLQVHAQVLISLIFGDKLNSEYVEFGLDGGFNYSDLKGISSDARSNLNLGFYFDFMLKKNPKWLINTGVIVKSTMGAEKLDVYTLDDLELDALFKDGKVNRKINYFNVPIVLKRNLGKGFYLGFGGMLGLRSKANDTFSKKIKEKDDLSYKLSVKEHIKTLDAGLLTSLNYKFVRGTGMSVYIKYYYGLVDVNANKDWDSQYNRSAYLGVCIPIGGVKSNKEKS